MRRAFVLLAMIPVLAVGACAPSPANSVGGVPVEPWTQEMLSALNARRAEAGVGPVELCGSLMRAAQSHSEDQAATSTMSHTGSDGATMRQRVERAGYAGWTNIGENVAAGQPDVGSVMGAWMNSSGHRDNMLGAAYQHVGLGLAQSGSGTPYWTQDFGGNGSC